MLMIEDFDTVPCITLSDGPYDTVAGFVLHRLQRIPYSGTASTYRGTA
ncbi:transporter associated domain-containing protein [Rhodococcus sp. T2V]